MSNDKLVTRLNRAIGQVEAIRDKLKNGNDEDCVETLRQLKAAVHALKNFGEAYMQENLERCFDLKKSKKEMKDTLSDVISASFSL